MTYNIFLLNLKVSNMDGGKKNYRFVNYITGYQYGNKKTYTLTVFYR